MHETPDNTPEGIIKTAGGSERLIVPNDTVGIQRVEEVFKEKGVQEIVGKLNGLEYKFIYIKTQTGWSLSEEVRGDDRVTYYQTINMRNGKYELFKNTVSNGKGSPGKIDLSIEGAKDKIADFISKIIIINAGRQTSSLDDTLAFA